MKDMKFYTSNLCFRAIRNIEIYLRKFQVDFARPFSRIQCIIFFTLSKTSSCPSNPWKLYSGKTKRGIMHVHFSYCCYFPGSCNSGITGNELREIVAVAAKLRNVLFLV